jgi:hypothetical protein
VAIWFKGPDLFARRAEIVAAVEQRLRLDPYGTLDVVLAPEEPFPLDLLDLLRGLLDRAQPSYLSRALAHRGEDLQRRIAVVLPRGALFDPDWIEAVREKAQVFRDQTLREALRDAEKLGDELPGARIVGETPADQISELARRADGDQVNFADRALETAWQQRILGFGDAR